MSDTIIIKRIWFTMVIHPSGTMRVGGSYTSKEVAKSWVPFVRKAWRGLRTKVVQCTLRYVNGKMDEASKRKLDKKFNMEPPERVGEVGDE